MIAGRPRYLQRLRQEYHDRLLNDPFERSVFEDRLKESNPDAELDPAEVTRRWTEEVGRRADARVASVPEILEYRMVPAGGGRLDLPPTSGPRPLDPATGRDPYSFGDTSIPDVDIAVFAHPDVARSTSLGSKEDTLASSYILDVENGPRFLVMPDLREGDFSGMQAEFTAALARFGRRARFQAWDISHHMQVGFAKGGKGTTVRAQSLRRLLRVLHEHRAASGPRGEPGVDVVIVSVNESLVDASTVYLLRSLGFEVYLASDPVTPGDVRVVTGTTGRGERFTGVVGQERAGMRPPSPTQMRAEIARDTLEQRHRLKQAELAAETDPARQAAIRDEITALDTQLTQLDELVHDYIRAVSAEAGRAHRAVSADDGRTHAPEPSVTPETGPEPGKFQRQNLEGWLDLQRLGRPITESATLTDAAQVLLRLRLGQDPPANTHEGAARARAREIGRLRNELIARRMGLETSGQFGWALEEAKAEYLSELGRYRGMLNDEIGATSQGVSQQLLRDEMASVVKEIQRVSTPPPGTESKTQVMPSGETAESRVVVDRPAEVEPAAEADQARAGAEPQGGEPRPVRGLLPSGQPATEPPAAPQPGRVTRAVGAGAEAFGRVMGGVMVYTTISGEDQLIDRYEKGLETGLGAVVGTMHNAGSAVAGVRMISGARVAPGVFVVLSMLDVIETSQRTYATSREHDTEVAYATARAAVNTALMYVGEALIATGNLVGIIAGTAVMFLGDKILKALGIHDLLEEAFAFEPREITRVHKHLAELLNQYQAVITLIGLEQRKTPELIAAGVSDPEVLRAQARAAADRHRVDASALVPGILDEFEAAYAEARTSYVGLSELDEWRREFLVLEQRANANDEDVGAWQRLHPEVNPDAGTSPPGGVSDQPAGPATPLRPPSDREVAMERFRRIETRMSLDAMTADEIREMKQWSELDSKFLEIEQPIMFGDVSSIDWQRVREREDEAQQILDNARYRLDPGAQGDYRATPLLAPGSEARRVYEAELEPRVRRLVWVRHLIMQAATGQPRPASVNPRCSAMQTAEDLECRPEMTDERVLQTAEEALGQYRQVVASQPALPEEIRKAVTAAAGSAESVGAASDYNAYVERHADYRSGLDRVRVAESSLIGLVDTSRRVLEPSIRAPKSDPASAFGDRFRALDRDAAAATRDRRETRGLLFPDEAAALTRRQRTEDLREFYRRLGGGTADRVLLKPEEIEILKSGDLGQRTSLVQRQEGELWYRIQQIQGLHWDGEGDLVDGVYRFVGTTPSGVSVDAARNALVGYAGPSETTRYEDVGGGESIAVPLWRVVALNAAAIAAFGGTGPFDIDQDETETVTLAEVRP
jgi:hypothetical protein